MTCLHAWIWHLFSCVCLTGHNTWEDPLVLAHSTCSPLPFTYGSAHLLQFIILGINVSVAFRCHVSKCLSMVAGGNSGSELVPRPKRLSKCSQVTAVSQNLFWESPTQRLVVAVFSPKCDDEGECWTLSNRLVVLVVTLAKMAKPRSQTNHGRRTNHTTVSSSVSVAKGVHWAPECLAGKTHELSSQPSVPNGSQEHRSSWCQMG